MEKKSTQRPINVENAEIKKRQTTKQKKKRFLELFAKRLCNVSKTCDVVGISRNTFYRWCYEDDMFKKGIENEHERFYDDLETTMYSKAITDKDTAMLIWLSKTKMKHRGYIEKIENDVTINPFEELMKAASVANDE